MQKYKVTQEYTYKSEEVYNSVMVNEDQLKQQIQTYLEPYFQYMDEVWDESEVVELVLSKGKFFWEDVLNSIEIKIEDYETN